MLFYEAGDGRSGMVEPARPDDVEHLVFGGLKREYLMTVASWPSLAGF